jgi:uncharacterized protein
VTKSGSQLKITGNLLLIERGQDKLLLTNTIEHRPLYIRQGGNYIKTFLKAAGELGTRKKIIQAYPQEKRLLEVMLEYGILVVDGADQRSRRLEAGVAAPSRKKHLSLYLLLSQSCNMRCVYCLDGQRTYQTDKNLRMSKDVAFRSVERCLDEIEEGGLLEVVFFGGEPLLNWPLAKEVIIHCEKCRDGEHKGKTRKYHMASNLSFLPPDLIEWARKYDISFLCDVDGPPAIHNLSRQFKDGRGTYESVAQNVQCISAAGLNVYLRATITAQNQDYLLEIAEQHKALGGRSSGFCPVHPVNTDGDILPQRLLPLPEKVIEGMTRVYRSKLWQEWQLFPFNVTAQRITASSPAFVGCGAPCGTILAVAANGDVYPCTFLVGVKRFHLGNIMDASFPKRDVLEWMFNELHVDHRVDCRQCSWRYLCGGGCPLERLMASDNPMATNEVKTYCKKMCCDYTKNNLEILLWEKAQEAATSQDEKLPQAPSCV